MDANIVDYVALKNPTYGPSSKKLVREIEARTIEGYGSLFVAYEVYGSLSELSPALAAEAVAGYFSLPLQLIEPRVETFALASSMSPISKVTYDAVHAALMMEEGVTTIATEDVENWGRIRRAWSRAAREHGLRLEPLKILQPSRYYPQAVRSEN